MTLEVFNSLELDSKANTLWKEGQFIMDRIVYGKHHINLYKLFNFYVEVYVSILKDEGIESLIVINEDEVLNLYTDLREVHLLLRNQ